jgi:hypothetical protein
LIRPQWNMAGEFFTLACPSFGHSDTGILACSSSRGVKEVSTVVTALSQVCAFPSQTSAL